jgi:phospholipase A1/A2
VLSGPADAVVRRSQAVVRIHFLNNSTATIRFAAPATVAATLRWKDHSEPTVLSAGAAAAAAEVKPGSFVQRSYAFTVPADADEAIELGLSGRAGTRIVIMTRAAPEGAGPDPDGACGTVPPASRSPRDSDPVHFFKTHFSGFEPIYFLAGSKSPNAKFQVSFKYQVLAEEGWLAGHVPELKALHLGYTQTSLWDLNRNSAPFLDSSYKPELVLIRPIRFERGPDWFHLDLQGGVQHESNGKDGTSSRSLNKVYFQPTVTLGRLEGLNLKLSPRAWLYLGELADNPDLADYRGYAELRTTVGWPMSLQLASHLRVGQQSGRLSHQLDATYPLSRLGSGSFSLYLHMQYFTGYGESLLFYNQKESIWRFGFSLYR